MAFPVPAFDGAAGGALAVALLGGFSEDGGEGAGDRFFIEAHGFLERAGFWCAGAFEVITGEAGCAAVVAFVRVDDGDVFYFSFLV